MRSLLTLFALLILSVSSNGQKTIDALFDRYAGDNDFVTITVNSNMLRLAKILDDCDKDDDFWPAEISRIRILVQENEERDAGNFLEMVEREINRKDYEEFMSIKKYDQDLVMLVRSEGNSFKEFLLIGGGEDNLIIQINGNLTYKDAKKFAERMEKDCEAGDISIAWN